MTPPTDTHFNSQTLAHSKVLFKISLTAESYKSRQALLRALSLIYVLFCFLFRALSSCCLLCLSYLMLTYTTIAANVKQCTAKPKYKLNAAAVTAIAWLCCQKRAVKGEWQEQIDRPNTSRSSKGSPTSVENKAYFQKLKLFLRQTKMRQRPM